MLWSGRVRRDERQVDFVFLRRRKRDLRLLSFFLDPLDRVGLLGQIDAAVLLEFVNDPIDEDVVSVVAAKMGVAIGRLHFENAVADFEDGNIERAAAQVVDRDLLVLLLIQPVSE